MNGIIVTGSGKYRTENNNGILKVYRNDKEWDRNLIGDKYILSLVERIEELERMLGESLPSLKSEIEMYHNFDKDK